MIIDGRALADTLVTAVAAEVATMVMPPRLAVFTCAPNFETKKFLAIKERQAAAAGVVLTVHELPATVTLSEVAASIAAVVPACDGVVVQLPFPAHLPTAALTALIPPSHDVDVLTYRGAVTDLLPPVVGAIDAMATAYGVVWAGKTVAVVGNGRLVGAPAAAFAVARGATVTVLTKESPDVAAVLAEADIIILGAGVPGLLLPTMIKMGVVVFDAGTSEASGVLVGDAAPTVAEKAALFTPVPGGIGPVTVAILLKNVLYLARLHRNDH